MIYLIGGPPRCGKTTLAKILSQLNRCGWIPVDGLEEIIYSQTPRSLAKKRFPKNDLCKRTNWENDPLYTSTSIHTIVSAYRRQGYASQKTITTFVQHLIHGGHDFILEGHQIHPALASRLTKQFPKEVRTVFLYKENVLHILKGFTHKTSAFDWVTEKTLDPSVLPLIATMLSCFGRWFHKEALRYHLPAYCVETHFQKTIRDIARIIHSTSSQKVLSKKELGNEARPSHDR